MRQVHDLIVVGGGPAGLSAAITARARNKDVLVVSNPVEENPLAASKLVENYPGMPKATGLHILETMHAQAHEMGARFLQARVISIIPMEGTESVPPTFSVTTSGDFVEARSIILACGASSGGRPIKGEREFLGRGVSYCATCDGMLYRSSTVLIVGLSPEAVDEAGFMAELGATVHFIASKAPAGLDGRIHMHVGKVLSIEGDALGVTHVNISERPFASPSGAEQAEQGNGAADGLQADRAENAQETDETADGFQAESVEVKLEVNGVFILRPGVAPANMLASLGMKNGYIKVDGDMRTNVKGVFAAGDCTGKPLQIAKAVGQGLTAVLSAVDYLST